MFTKDFGTLDHDMNNRIEAFRAKRRERLPRRERPASASRCSNRSEKSPNVERREYYGGGEERPRRDKSQRQHQQRQGGGMGGSSNATSGEQWWPLRRSTHDNKASGSPTRFRARRTKSSCAQIKERPHSALVDIRVSDEVKECAGRQQRRELEDSDRHPGDERSEHYPGGRRSNKQSPGREAISAIRTMPWALTGDHPLKRTSSRSSRRRMRRKRSSNRRRPHTATSAMKRHSSSKNVREKGWVNSWDPGVTGGGIPTYNAFADKHCVVAKTRNFRKHFAKQAGEYCEELRPLAFKRVDVAPWQFMEQWEYRKQQAMEKQQFQTSEILPHLRVTHSESVPMLSTRTRPSDLKSRGQRSAGRRYGRSRSAKGRKHHRAMDHDNFSIVIAVVGGTQVSGTEVDGNISQKLVARLMVNEQSTVEDLRQKMMEELDENQFDFPLQSYNFLHSDGVAIHGGQERSILAANLLPIAYLRAFPGTLKRSRVTPKDGYEEEKGYNTDFEDEEEEDSGNNCSNRSSSNICTKENLTVEKPKVTLSEEEEIYNDEDFEDDEHNHEFQESEKGEGSEMYDSTVDSVSRRASPMSVMTMETADDERSLTTIDSRRSPIERTTISTTPTDEKLFTTKEHDVLPPKKQLVNERKPGKKKSRRGKYSLTRKNISHKLSPLKRRRAYDTRLKERLRKRSNSRNRFLARKFNRMVRYSDQKRPATASQALPTTTALSYLDAAGIDVDLHGYENDPEVILKLAQLIEKKSELQRRLALKQVHSSTRSQSATRVRNQNHGYTIGYERLNVSKSSYEQAILRQRAEHEQRIYRDYILKSRREYMKERIAEQMKDPEKPDGTVEDDTEDADTKESDEFYDEETFGKPGSVKYSTIVEKQGNGEGGDHDDTDYDAEDDSEEHSNPDTERETSGRGAITMHHENESALKIQSIQRGRMARQRMQAKRRALVEERENAVIIIQGASRRRQAIKRVRAMRGTEGATIWIDEELMGRKRTKAATRIQSIHRGRVGRNRHRRRVQERLEEGAAITIQTQVRGRVQRKQYTVKKVIRVRESEMAVRIQKISRGRLSRKMYERHKLDRHRAAVHIQGSARRRMAHNRVIVLREERMACSATRIQGQVRRRNAQRDVAEHRRNRSRNDNAATSIQTAYRGRIGRRRVSRVAATKHYGKHYTKIEERRRRQRERASSAIEMETVQTTAREFEEKVAPNGGNRDDISAVKIQAVYRGRKARMSAGRTRLRKHIRRRERAATRLQSRVRGRLSRNHHQRQRHAATRVQCVARGRSARRSVRVYRERRSRRRGEEEGAAMRVQTIVRGRQCRQRHQQNQKAATQIQAVARRRITGNEQKQRHHAAVRMQSAARGRLVRRRGSSENHKEGRIEHKEGEEDEYEETFEDEGQEGEEKTTVRDDEEDEYDDDFDLVVDMDIPEKSADSEVPVLLTNPDGTMSVAILSVNEDSSQAATSIQAMYRGQRNRQHHQQEKEAGDTRGELRSPIYDDSDFEDDGEEETKEEKVEKKERKDGEEYYDDEFDDEAEGNGPTSNPSSETKTVAAAEDASYDDDFE